MEKKQYQSNLNCGVLAHTNGTLERCTPNNSRIHDLSGCSNFCCYLYSYYHFEWWSISPLKKCHWIFWIIFSGYNFFIYIKFISSNEFHNKIYKIFGDFFCCCFFCLFTLPNETRNEYTWKIENIWKIKRREPWYGKNSNKSEKKTHANSTQLTINGYALEYLVKQLTVCIRILLAHSHSNVAILWMTYVIFFVAAICCHCRWIYLSCSIHWISSLLLRMNGIGRMTKRAQNCQRKKERERERLL